MNNALYFLIFKVAERRRSFIIRN